MISEHSITCPVCHREMRALTSQHILKHGFSSASEFKTRFGLTYLKCASMRKAQSDFMNQNPPTAGGHSPESIEKMSRNRKGKGLGVAGKYERTPEIRRKISKSVDRAYEEGRLKRFRKSGTPSKGYRAKLRWVWSDRMFQKVRVRSSWEARVIRVLDLHPCVENYKYEPFSIPYSLEGEIRNYIPDLIVNLEGGITEVWEIKPEEFWNDAKNLLKWKALCEFCEIRGFNCILVSLSMIEGMERQVGIRPWVGPGGAWVRPDDPSFRPRSRRERLGLTEENRRGIK